MRSQGCQRRESVLFIGPSARADCDTRRLGRGVLLILLKKFVNDRVHLGSRALPFHHR
jgi:hypothetical protein